MALQDDLYLQEEEDTQSIVDTVIADSMGTSVDTSQGPLAEDDSYEYEEPIEEEETIEVEKPTVDKFNFDNDDEISEVPKISNNLDNEEAIKALVAAEARRQGVPVDLALAVANQESRFNPKAKSPVGAYGVMQLMPAAAEEMGVNRYDVADNIKGGVGYLAKQLKNTNGDIPAALANYNFGPGAAPKARATGTPYPEETRNYIDIIGKTRDLFVNTAYADDLEEVPGYQADPQSPAQVAAFVGGENLPEEEGESGTVRDFSNNIIPLTSSPEFLKMPLNERLNKFSDLFNSKTWDKETYDALKHASTIAINGAAPDEKPPFKDMFGTPPTIATEEDPDAVLSKWKDSVRQNIFDAGKSPALFGDQLDEYLDKAAEDEKAAYDYRNNSRIGENLETIGNWARDAVKGVVTGYTKPLAGIVRIAGRDTDWASDVANYIEDKPQELLGDPDKSYLYEVDAKGYIVDNPDGTPRTKWQTSIAQTAGAIGGLLAGGALLRVAGYGTTALVTAFGGVNTFTRANDSFRLVEEETGDKEKAYTASLWSLPAAALDTAADMFVGSKIFAPYVKSLSKTEFVKYAAKKFARDASVVGATTGVSETVQQVGEIQQTGGELDSARTQQAMIGSAIGAGVVGAAEGTFGEYAAQKQKVIRQYEHRAEVGEKIERFAESPDDTMTLPTEQVNIAQEQRDRLGIEVIEDGKGNSIITKKKDVVLEPGTPENINDALEVIGRSETPADMEGMQRERTSLLAKKDKGTLTDLETQRLTDLNEVIGTAEDPKYNNNIKAYEKQVREALDMDPSLLPVQWVAGLNKWQHVETGETSISLKDVLYPKQKGDAVYTEDVSKLDNVELIDEDTLVFDPATYAARETELATRQQELLDTLTTKQEEFNTAVRTYKAEKLEADSNLAYNESKAFQREQEIYESKKTKAQDRLTNVEKELTSIPPKQDVQPPVQEAAVKIESLRTDLEAAQAATLKIRNDIGKIEGRQQKNDAKNLLQESKERERTLKAQMLELKKTARSEKKALDDYNKIQKNNARRTSLEEQARQYKEVVDRITNEGPPKPREVKDYSESYNRQEMLRKEGLELKEQFAKTQQETKELLSGKKQAEKEIAEKRKITAKIAKKGLGALITSDKKQTIVIPSGLTPEAKQQVTAHELGHVLSDKLNIPKEVEDSVNAALESIKTRGNLVSVGDITSETFLPEVQKATKYPAGSTLNELDKISREAVTSRREYLANQIGAEILRREGVDVGSLGMDINPELALYLSDVALPTTKQLQESNPSVRNAAKEPSTGIVAKEDIPVDAPTNKEDATIQEVVDRSVNMSPTESVQKVAMDARTGKIKETQFSKRTRSKLPEAEAHYYEAINRANTLEETQRIVNSYDFDTIKGFLTNDDNPIDLRYRLATADALLNKAQADFNNNPTEANRLKFQTATSLRNGTTQVAQALQSLRGSYDAPTFSGFIKTVERALKESLGDNFKPESIDYALKELSALYNQAKEMGYAPGSKRNDFVHAGVQKILETQGIDQKTWVQSFIRSNLLSGAGTQAINAVGGFTQGVVFTALSHPLLLPSTIKAMMKSGKTVAIADAKRTLAGKNVSLMLRNVMDPTPLLIQDSSSPLRKAQSAYNRAALKLFRISNAVDAWNRRVSADGYIHQETVKALKKKYVNDPAGYTAAASKFLVDDNVLKNAMAAEMNIAEKAGVNITKADAAVYAYEKLRNTSYGADAALTPILERASDWADVISLRGGMSHALPQIIDVINRQMLSSKFAPAAVIVSPFTRAVAALMDMAIDIVPGSIAYKYGEKYYYRNNPEELARINKQMERSVAGQKVGLLLTSALLTGVLSDAIEITGDPEEVLDMDPTRGADPKGKPAKDRKGFEEYKQTGETPFTIKFKGMDEGIVYKDLPGLNVIAYGVYQAKKAIDKGMSPTDAALAFYRGTIRQLGNVSLLGPYKKFLEDLTTPDTTADNALEKLGNALGKVAKSNVNMAIPFSGALRDIKKVYDESPEESNQPIWSALFKDIPVASELFGSKPALDVFGEPETRSTIERIPGAMRMLGAEKEAVDPVALGLQKRGIIVPELQRTIKFNNSDFPSPMAQQRFYSDETTRLSKSLSNAFTPDEWYDFQRSTGPKIKNVAQSILQSNMPTEQAQRELIRRVGDIRKNAKKNFIRTGSFN